MWCPDRIRPFRFAVAASVLALVLGVSPVSAVPSDDAIEIGQRILERYDVREVDGAIRLYPHDAESAVRSIEITDDGDVLVNGKEFDRDELTGFLGVEGEHVRDLAELDDDDRRAALGLAGESATTGTGEPRRRRSEGVHIEVPVGVPGTHINVRVSGDDRVSVGRSIHVRENETARDVVCIGCSVDIDGETSGDVVAVGGSVRVSGTVGGEATAVGGSVLVRDGAVVEGNAVAIGGTVQVHDGGEVRGEETTVGFGGPWMHGWGSGWGSGWAFPWGAFSDTGRLLTSVMRTGLLALLAVLSVLLLGPVVDRMSQRAGDEPWKAAFAGLLMQLLFLPLLVIVIVVLAVSIIGIPLLLLVPFALVAFLIGWFLGFVAVAKALGGWVERRFGWNASSVAVAVIVGIVLIQATTLAGRLISLPGGWLAMFGFTLVGFGFFLKYVAWTIGLGAATLVALSGEWRRRSTAVAPPPPPPPPSGEPGWETAPQAAAEPEYQPPARPGTVEDGFDRAGTDPDRDEEPRI